MMMTSPKVIIDTKHDALEVASPFTYGYVGYISIYNDIMFNETHPPHSPKGGIIHPTFPPHWRHVGAATAPGT